MSLHNYLNRIRRLDALIRQRRTGPPKVLAEKLGISERWLYIFLDELRTELDCPICYDRMRRSYIYDKPGKVIIGFTKEMNHQGLREISGGILQSKFLILFFDHKAIFKSDEIHFA
jgi:hypothetical protein